MRSATVCRGLNSAGMLCVRADLTRQAFVSKLKTPVSARNSRRQSFQCRALFGGGTTKPVPSSIYDITVNTIDGSEVSMAQYKGKVVLVVNVASQCGFTPQYKELVALYDKYKGQGLEIIAQPCNQFGGQEPGSNQEVKAFAQRQGAAFALLSKGDVNGADEKPLWSYLKAKQGGILGNDIKWNFSKFLVDRQGNVVKRYPSTTAPLQIEADIKALL